ncbi:hypothetical protein KP509_08G047300 [Ceratopteris richardii]|uniref:Secreted protein n=1 Tax=Ceratopteris richardii TaxID=49495 RepID=A0A8T2UCZ2_CERRI|nr:hypothetical protein KP509_08G047300 [Ceratopteris richardii]
MHVAFFIYISLSSLCRGSEQQLQRQFTHVFNLFPSTYFRTSSSSRGFYFYRRGRKPRFSILFASRMRSHPSIWKGSISKCF